MSRRHYLPVMFAVLGVWAVLVALMEGALSGLVLWNWLPILICCIILDPAKTAKHPKQPLLAKTFFAVSGMAVSLYFHISWFFNLGGMASSSSTSGLIMLVIPFLSIGVGTMGFVLGLILELERKAEKTKPGN